MTLISADTLDRSSADLLREAVYQNSETARPGLLERTFAFAFRSMVYPQIWEDPRADMEALQIGPSSRIMTIASGGCNVLSYLTANPARIYAVDLNATHVALVRLKIAAAVHLPNHATFLRFFGGASDWRNVRLYDELVAPHLDADTRAYWEGREITGRRRITRFARNFYRYGLLGSFIGMGHLTAKLLGADPKKVMTARTLEEQKQMFDAELAPLFDKPIVRWATSKRASLFGLGIPPAQYDALCDNGRLRMADVLRERCGRLATGFDLNDNYFAWQAFARRYAGPGDGLTDAPGGGPWPIYLEKDNFPAIRSRANRVDVVKENMIHFLKREPAQSLDRYVLLDAQDWMDDPTLNALWREITRTARPGARVIFRTAGEASILPGRVDRAILDQWTYDAKTSASIHAKDRSAIYGGFHLYLKAE
jgi:S-adenosylmethionine-diacylglycerol 3-amino-3-carboxypropyl transferase